jgi:hypothetical protein
VACQLQLGRSRRHFVSWHGAQFRLEALEKVRPELAKHVVTLLVDPTNDRKALRALQQMGEDARDAIPVIGWHTKKGLVQRQR